MQPLLVEKVSIRNYKSIKEMDFSCSRVNVFIGEPNTGKSNILEAIALLGGETNIKNNQGENTFRISKLDNLFYDNDVFEEIKISSDKDSIKIYYSNSFFFQLNNEKDIQLAYKNNKKLEFLETISIKNPVYKFYKFLTETDYSTSGYSRSLEPVYGKNLFTLISSTKALKNIVSAILKQYNYLLQIDFETKSIGYSKFTEDSIINYPFSSLSDTLKRYIFYSVVIESNNDSVLLFEEQESFMYAEYVANLAEKIAENKSNQYFIITHSPTMLNYLHAKLSKEELSVFGVYSQDYKTQIKKISDEQLVEAEVGDIISNTHLF